MARHINSSQSALLLGGGYVAAHLARALTAKGIKVTVTSRTGKTDIPDVDVLPFHTNVRPSAALKTAFETADIILSSIPPARKRPKHTLQDPALKALSNLTPRASWIGYLSATSVYGDRKGQWAFEGEPPTPNLKRGQRRADAELAWIETLWPVHIFRLAGIYGPGRSPFKNLRKGSARAVVKEGHVVNRIHIDDIISALMASIEKPDPQRVYNLADNNPAPSHEVLELAAFLLDCPPPPHLAENSSEVSDMQRSFYSETKRINAERAMRELSWKPRHSDYRSGLLSILRSETGNDNAVYLCGKMNAPAEDAANIQAALPQHIALTQDEPGNLEFRVTADPKEPTLFHVFEVFDNWASFSAHQTRTENSAWAKISAQAERDFVLVANR